MLKRSHFPYMVLAPMVALLVVFTIIPIGGSFVIAFFDYNPLRETGNSFVGLKNFVSLFSDELFQIALRNTFYYVFAMVGVNIAFTVIVAQLLCSLKSNAWRSLFRVNFFMPCVAPLAAVTIVWTRSLFVTKSGLNLILGWFGASPVNWLGNAATLMPSLILMSLWADVGYNIVLFIAGIQGIPTDFFEAAMIDGAGAFRKFFMVTLPLLARTMAFVLAMTFISQFQAFAQFSIGASDGGVGRAGLVLSTYIYNVGFKIKDMGYASAISIALFVIIMVVTALQRLLNRVDWGY